MTKRAAKHPPPLGSPAVDRLHKWRKTPDGIEWSVAVGGEIQPDTLRRLRDLIRERTDFHHHVAVEVNCGSVLKTIDNEEDAQETIRRLDALPVKHKSGSRKDRS